MYSQGNESEDPFLQRIKKLVQGKYYVVVWLQVGQRAVMAEYHDKLKLTNLTRIF